ncbi:uracil-DNA glycosylase [bacterium]|nr:uracil-DNA glycosylase [bacterium]
MNERDIELKKIRDEVLKCRKCLLYKTRTLPVIGQGNHQAKIMFIGEAPGYNEDKTGRPFCGKAGAVLDELLKSINLKREDVYITNLLKCRPPNNRDPEEKEIKACSPYLERQIEIIKPKIICTLGRYSMAYIMKKYGLENELQSISKIHGKVFQTKDIKIIPLYHPAVAVYNQNMIKILKSDFNILNKSL